MKQCCIKYIKKIQKHPPVKKIIIQSIKHVQCALNMWCMVIRIQNVWSLITERICWLNTSNRASKKNIYKISGVSRLGLELFIKVKKKLSSISWQMTQSLYRVIWLQVRHKKRNVKVVCKKSSKETEDTGGIFMGGSKYTIVSFTVPPLQREWRC